MQLNELTDVELIDSVRAGNDDAFGELMRRYKSPLVNFVYRLLGNEADAVEIAQDVFVRVYQHLADIDRAQKFSTWLFALARNAAIDRLRYRQRHPTAPLDAAPEPATHSHDVENREVGRQVAAAVAELPDDQRTALVLAEYHGLSQVEIAVVLRCSVKSVESRLYRAKQTLRARLAKLRSDG